MSCIREVGVSTIVAANASLLKPIEGPVCVTHPGYLGTLDMVKREYMADTGAKIEATNDITVIMLFNDGPAGLRCLPPLHFCGPLIPSIDL